jgi:hypothetical protein
VTSDQLALNQRDVFAEEHDVIEFLSRPEIQRPFLHQQCVHALVGGPSRVSQLSVPPRMNERAAADSVGRGGEWKAGG